jgi:stage II sporulation protein D
MRRWLPFLLTSVILCTLLIPTEAAQSSSFGAPVRVGLLYGDSAVPEVRLSSTSGLALAQLPEGETQPQPIFQAAGDVGWGVRPDAIRLQFGPYGSLAAARADLAAHGTSGWYIVRQLGKHYLRTAAFASTTLAEQALQSLRQHISPPGEIIGSRRAQSGDLPDLAAAEALCTQLRGDGFAAILVWTGSCWRVAVGQAASDTAAAALCAELNSEYPAVDWTVAKPGPMQVEIVALESESVAIVPSTEVYIGAAGGTPPLTTIHAGSIQGQPYPGYVQFSLQTNARLQVVLYQTMDDYLACLVAREMSSSFPLEALKAQAVCARNLLEARRSYHQSNGFDVCASTHCQVVGEYTRVNAKVLQAVAETRGLVITHKGSLIPVYYHADAGGYTENNENVWIGGPIVYLRSVEELYPSTSPYSSWKETLTSQQLLDLLGEQGAGLGRIVSVEPTGRTAAGRVTGLRISDSQGKTVVLEREAARLPGYYLKSRMYTIETDLTPVSVQAADGEIVQQQLQGLRALTAQGATVLSRADSYAIQGANGATVRLAAQPDAFTFIGSGFGHGVGMSQWGAVAMAQNGHTYEDILKHYYQGIEITRLGD